MARIIYSSDEMQAVLDLEAGERFEAEALRAWLAAEGIAVGLIAPAAASIDQVVGPASVPVAMGRPAIEGENARIEYAFRAGRAALRPTIREDGTADFRDLGLVTTVQPGQVLARRIPPAPGRDGMTVKGKPIKARPGMDRRLRVGEGVALSEDGNVAVAERAGHPALDGTAVVVRQEFMIPGSVSLATGHVVFDGDLVIHGSVDLQMEVRATGSVTVGGNVEGALIIAGGTVTVRGGVRHQATIQAGGDVVAKYIEHATIRCGGSLGVQEDLIHSRAEVEGAVVVGGGVIGGEVWLGERLEARSLGARLGTPTSITAVVPQPEAEELRAIEAERAEIQQKLALITPKVREAQEALRHPARAQIDLEVFRRVLELSASLNEQDAALAERAAAIAQLPPRVRPRLVLREGLYPGVKVQLGQAFLRTDDLVPAGTLVEEQGSVRLLPR
ncbi:MAG: FapA family protein [Candidatus Sericytochromatia bacterium]